MQGRCHQVTDPERWPRAHNRSAWQKERVVERPHLLNPCRLTHKPCSPLGSFTRGLPDRTSPKHQPFFLWRTRWASEPGPCRGCPGPPNAIETRLAVLRFFPKPLNENGYIRIQRMDGSSCDNPKRFNRIIMAVWFSELNA